MAINPSLVPTINPGDLFTRFTEDSTLNIRWLTATDPAYFDILNRPMYDITVRQLILAKAMDSLNLSLGYQAIFPFVIPPQVTDGSTIVDVPIRLFWDMHVSLPGGQQSSSWGNIRLARIDRLDGDNGTNYSGTLRFIFTGQSLNGDTLSAQETALFYADYTIDSDLTYQRIRVEPATLVACPGFSVIGAGVDVTIDGYIVFRTLDTSETTTTTFYDLLAPGTSAYYQIVDSAGSVTDPDFDALPLTHGTGVLTPSAVNIITPVNADPVAWLDAFNYPFSIDASLAASDSSGITIPSGLFSEFNLVVPASDQPTGDSSGANYPVWISRIERTSNTTTPTLIIYFATYGISPVDAGNAIEFATLTLTDDMVAGQVVEITPSEHLFPTQASADWHQEFGRGHVVLSTKWSDTSAGSEVSDFFTAFPLLVGSSSSAAFASGSTRISSWGLSRIPKYTPTAGQAAAMLGTTSTRTTPVYPSSTNKFVTEKDEGLGDVVDLEAQAGINQNSAIERYGYKGTRVHQTVKLIVDPELASETPDPAFYNDEILPRLRVLLGRDPLFGDEWYNGNRFVKFNGDSWVG